jgi:uncharacterized protein (DUF4415 family)
MPRPPLVVVHTRADASDPTDIGKKGQPMAKRGLPCKVSNDFSKGKRGAGDPFAGKTRITIMLDDDVIEAFRRRAEAAGRGYQTEINRCSRHARR